MELNRIVVRIKTFAILAVVMLLFVFPSEAQTEENPSDIELWSGLGVEKSFLNKKLELGLQQQFRFNENIGHLNTYFTQAQVQFNFHQNWSVLYGFRYINKNTDLRGFEKRHRSHLDLMARHKIDRLKLSYRLRFQERRDIPEVFGDYPVTKYRLRVKASYNIKKNKITPYTAAELFYAPQTNEDSGLSKVRFTAGITRKNKKIGKLNLCYRLEQEFSAFTSPDQPFTYHIIGLNYTFKI